MTFDYQPTADDYVDAQCIHTKKHYGKRGIWVLGGLAFIIILGIVSLGLWIAGQEPPATSLWIIDISLIFTGVWLWSGVSWRKQFYKIQALQAPLKITIGDDAILYESARGSSTNVGCA
jgi:hypothetical protein